MAFTIQNKGRDGGKSNITSVTKSQRATCVAVFYRWDDFELSKIINVKAGSKGSTGIGAGGSSASGNLDTKPRVIVDNDIVRCSINKNKGTSSGSFSITMKQGFQEKGGRIVTDKKINYLNVLHPGDWVFLYMKKNSQVNVDSVKESSGLKMIGIVENVRYIEVDDPQTGRPRLEYIVTGRDFGKVFDMSIFFNPILSDKTIQTILGAKFLTASKNAVDGAEKEGKEGLPTPDQVLKNVISFYLGGTLAEDNQTNQPWYIPKNMANLLGVTQKAKSKGVSFYDILNLDRIGLHKYSKYKFSEAEALLGRTFIKSLPASGTVWSVLQFLQNAVLNEMFVDLAPDSNGNLKPSITIRQLPFSNKKGIGTNSTNVFDIDDGSAKDTVQNSEKTYYVDLPQLKIKSTDVKQKNIGKSEFERINHLIVVPRVDTQDFNVGFVSSINIPSVQRYGLKTFQAQTAYALDQKENFVKYCEKCINLLQDWFFLSHALYNGTLIIDGVDGFIELGTNVYITDVGQLFHVEGYTHLYEIQAGTGQIVYDTELRVSRGQSFDGRSSKFIDTEKNRNDSTTLSISGLENVRNLK